MLYIHYPQPPTNGHFFHRFYLSPSLKIFWDFEWAERYISNFFCRFKETQTQQIEQECVWPLFLGENVTKMTICFLKNLHRCFDQYKDISEIHRCLNISEFGITSYTSTHACLNTDQGAYHSLSKYII